MSTNRTVLALALTVGVGLTAIGLAGCGGAAKALGMTKVTPDEFRVVSKAPLVIPPDYGLRPPTPGALPPAELQPESAARNALLGQREAVARSEGEKLLVQKAGADKADPLVRYVVDDEFGALAHKDPSFADRVLFWRKPAADGKAAVTAAEAGADTPAPVDAAAEAKRVQGLTGDQQVVIARDPETKGKLPGL